MKEKFIMKVLEKLTPTIIWYHYDERADQKNQKSLENMDILEKMIDYLLNELFEITGGSLIDNDFQYSEIAYKKEEIIKRLKDKYFRG